MTEAARPGRAAGGPRARRRPGPADPGGIATKRPSVTRRRRRGAIRAEMCPVGRREGIARKDGQRQ